MANKYEQLIESIVNENEEAAKKLFHEIVIEESRKIYEGLQDEEMGGEDFADDLEAEHDVIDGDEEGVDDEDFGDADAATDIEDEVGEDGLEDRVMDLEDALDELKAEFDALMNDEGSDDLEGDDDVELDDEADLGDDSDFDGDADLEGDDEEGFGEASVYGKPVREYVEKVARPNVDTEGSEVGSGGKSASVNKRSTTISGKNDMGGTTANITRGGSETNPDGKQFSKPNNAYSKGQKEIEGSGDWQNRPGANTKGYKDKRTAKTTEGNTTGDSVKVNKDSLNSGGKSGYKG